jgi:hypothetical protein
MGVTLTGILAGSTLGTRQRTFTFGMSKSLTTSPRRLPEGVPKNTWFGTGTLQGLLEAGQFVAVVEARQGHKTGLRRGGRLAHRVVE